MADGPNPSRSSSGQASQSLPVQQLAAEIHGSSTGSLSPLSAAVSTRTSVTLPQHSVHPVSPPPTAMSDERPSLGPLAKIPLRPSLRPVLQLDLDAVAEQLSIFQGAAVTQEDLRNSFPIAKKQPQSPLQPSSVPKSFASVYPSGTETPVIPLSVEVAGVNDDREGQNLVLQFETVEEALGLSDSPDSPNEMGDKVDASKGWAVSVPVSEPFEPPLQTWPTEPAEIMDEETSLLEHEPQGVDLAKHGDMVFQPDTIAVVQRQGNENDFEDQRVIVSVPETTGNGVNSGFIIPNYDSNENLTELLVVVPPEHVDTPTSPKKVDATSTNTAETTSEAIEQIAHFIPPMPAMFDMESTVVVRGSATNATLTMNVRREVSTVGYLILTVALFSLASQGVVVRWIPGVKGMITAAWLMQCQTIVMLPFAVFQFMHMEEEERRQWKLPSTLKLLVVASLSFLFWSCGFYLAIDYTSMFHAWSLCNIHSVAIVLIGVGRSLVLKKLSRVVSAKELSGACVATAGLILMQIPNILSWNVRTFCGDFIAALSSLGAIVYLDSCKELRGRVSFFPMMTFISALSSFTFAISSMILSGTNLSVTDHGVFGWLQTDRHILGLYLGCVVGFLGTVSCIASLKYLPSVVVSSVQSMIPVVGTTMAVLMGTEHVPDVWTTLGGSVLLCGVLVIADATKRSEVTVVLNEHLTS